MYFCEVEWKNGVQSTIENAKLFTLKCQDEHQDDEDINGVVHHIHIQCEVFMVIVILERRISLKNLSKWFILFYFLRS